MIIVLLIIKIIDFKENVNSLTIVINITPPPPRKKKKARINIHSVPEKDIRHISYIPQKFPNCWCPAVFKGCYLTLTETLA